MDKDKELLLHIGESDSDEVVEEFKLPPPRTRRPRARKAVAEARINAANYSLISWKCCLLFLLIIVFISGALVLTFFMLSMQSEISELRQKAEQADGQLKHQASLEVSSKKMVAELEEYKEKLSNQDLNNKLLVHQIAHLNKTVKISSTKLLSLKSSVLTKDLDSLKSGMADTGADISKMEAQLNNHENKIYSILSELKSMKIAFYNSSVKNSTELDKLTRPISAQTQEIRKLKELIHVTNKTNQKFMRKMSDELNQNGVKDDTSYNELNTAISVQAEEIRKIKESTHLTNNTNKNIMRKMADELYQNGVKDDTSYNELNNAVNSLKRTHLKKISKLRKIIFASINTSNTQLANLQRNINFNKNLSLSNKIDIIHLKNMSKIFAEKVVQHHLLSQNEIGKKNSAKSSYIFTSTSHTPVVNLNTMQPLVTTKIDKQDTVEEDCIAPCSIGEECKKTDYGFSCVCQKGFVEGKKFCEDIDECQMTNACHTNASCSNTFGSYKCTCNDGFQGNGTHCKESVSMNVMENYTLENITHDDNKSGLPKMENITYQINVTSLPSIDDVNTNRVSPSSLVPNVSLYAINMTDVFYNSSTVITLPLKSNDATELSNSTIKTMAGSISIILNGTGEKIAINASAYTELSNSTKRNINIMNGSINGYPIYTSESKKVLPDVTKNTDEFTMETLSTTPFITLQLPDKTGVYAPGIGTSDEDDQLGNDKQGLVDNIRELITGSEDSDMTDLNSMDME